MHKHIHLVEAMLITLVIGVIGFFGYTEMAINESASKQEGLVQLQEPEFTTVITKQLQPPPLKTQSQQAPVTPRSKVLRTNQSDLLANISFEEQEYTALLSPNDPQHPLWFWDRINIEQAWDFEAGESGVVIAVIDSGFALGHQELNDGWYINDGEQGTTIPTDVCWDGIAKNKQSNGCDDDQNNYVDDWRGWDFYSVNNNPQAGQTDPNGDGVAHGTLVSGLVGAQANNAIGFAGADWAAKIMPLQALSDHGSGFTSDIVAAIEYAVDNGADVINMSIGGANNDPAMQAAVSYARSQNVVVVAASGNCATLAYSFCSQLSAPGYMGYPALYEEVISVGATNSSNTRASFSSYGPELDVVAPGQGLSISTSWNNSNQTSAYAGGISGTSFASPITAGVVGLIKAYDPSLSNDSILQLLRLTSTPYGSPFDQEYGYGLINAGAALESLANGTSGSIIGRERTAPTVTTSAGQNPASPLAIGQNVTSTVSASGGDQLSISAVQINSGQRVEFQAQKTDDSGNVTYTWDTNFLGSGPWRLTPSSQEVSGISETIYIN